MDQGMDARRFEPQVLMMQASRPDGQDMDAAENGAEKPVGGKSHGGRLTPEGHARAGPAKTTASK